ncbi:MAG TPA: hypothetical protein VMU30_05060 [Bacteroidota bacterium]|nr:hypothetical protein [Bacteroidota bacterium]
MVFQIKVRVDVSKMKEFGQKLQMNELDRSCIRGETYCLKDDPAFGFSIWEAISKDEFEMKFAPWRKYYSEVEVKEVITPMAAMMELMKQLSK